MRWIHRWLVDSPLRVPIMRKGLRVITLWKHSQRACDEIMMLLWRQNDVVLTSWWRHCCIVIFWLYNGAGKNHSTKTSLWKMYTVDSVLHDYVFRMVRSALIFDRGLGSTITKAPIQILEQNDVHYRGFESSRYLTIKGVLYFKKNISPEYIAQSDIATSWWNYLS